MSLSVVLRTLIVLFVGAMAPATVSCFVLHLPQDYSAGDSRILSPRKLPFTSLCRHYSSPQDDDDSSMSPKFNLNLVLIDHYDSYTYNLYDMLAQLCTRPPLVLCKDAVDEWKSLEHNVDGIILSPGPGTPHCETDMGLSLDLIRQHSETPILGVCLGHQALGHVYGASVELSPRGPVHGQVRSVVPEAIVSSTSTRNWPSLWTNLTEAPVDVTRYHSLVVDLNHDSNQKIPLLPTAWSYDNDVPILMGLQHVSNPHYGVQFHPESIGTPCGMQLLQNFCSICLKAKTQQAQSRQPKQRWNPATYSMEESRHRTGEIQQNETRKRPLEVLVHKLRKDDNEQVPATPEVAFQKLFGKDRHAVWLDSSNSEDGSGRNKNARFSILASHEGGGSLSRRVEYYGQEYSRDQRGVYVYSKSSDDSLKSQRYDTDILTYLRDEVTKSGMLEEEVVVHVGSDGTVLQSGEAPEVEALPFEYRGGFVGFLGYEVRHDSQLLLERSESGLMHNSVHPPVTTHSKNCNPANVPSAFFLFADQSLVYDHWKEEWYLVGLAAKKESRDSVLTWMKQTERALQQIKMPTKEAVLASRVVAGAASLAFVPNRSRKTYQENIATCHEQIRQGESYELCLTNQLQARVPIIDSYGGDGRTRRPLELYQVLRRRNPAPYSAFLNFQTGNSAAVSICCSSPERFVSVKKSQPTISGISEPARLLVEAKPIKGTSARDMLPNGTPRCILEDRRRAEELEACVKNRAENLMIVDLLRNDLSRVCETGSVHVPKLMSIESFATVHQMVSTIRGTLDKGKNAVDVLGACFPGGSMTGAPKLRTTEILHDMEEFVSRGPYSGCLGYLSPNGSMDMNIVIRSAVVTRHDDEDSYQVSVGAGGAITALSESEDEYEEMLLKARAVMEAVQTWSNMRPSISDHEKVTNATTAFI